jgi:hypothetical protein
MDCKKVGELCNFIVMQAHSVVLHTDNLDSTTAFRHVRMIRELCDLLEKEITPSKSRPAAIEP